MSYDSSSSVNPLNQSNDKLYSLNKPVEENKIENSTLNRSESKIKIKKLANIPDENVGLVNKESKNYTTKNEKLAAKFGIVQDPGTLNATSINMKLHHIETDVSKIKHSKKQNVNIIYISNKT